MYDTDEVTYLHDVNFFHSLLRDVINTDHSQNSAGEARQPQQRDV